MATVKSRNVLQIRLSVIFCLAMMLLSSCRGEGQQNAMLPTPTLVDPHNHVVDVSQTNLPPEFLAKLKIVEVTSVPDAKQEDSTLNQSETLRAFTIIHKTKCNIFIEDIGEGTILEIQGFSPPWRPFSDLVWLTDDILVFDRWSNPHYGIHYVVDVGEKQVISAAAFPDQMPLPEEALTSDGADLQTNTELHCSTVVETRWGDGEFAWGRCPEDGSPGVPFYPAVGPDGQIFVLDPAHQRLLIYTEHSDPAIISIDPAYAFEGVCKYSSPQWRNVSVSGERWFLNFANFDTGRFFHQVATFPLDSGQVDAHFSLEPYYPAQLLLTKALISDKQGGVYLWLDSGGLVHLDADLRPSFTQLGFDYTDNLTVGWDNHVYTYQADEDRLKDHGNPGALNGPAINVYDAVLAGSAVELPALVRLIGADAAGHVYFSVSKLGQHYYVRLQPGGAAQVAPKPAQPFKGVDVAADGSLYSLVYDLEDLSINPKIVKCTFSVSE